MTGHRIKWIWPLLTTVLLFGLLNISPTRAQGVIVRLVGGTHSGISSLVVPSSHILPSARIKATAVQPSPGAVLFSQKSERTGMGHIPPAGTQDNPYTNYRFADHYLRSATVLIARLPSRQPHLRIRTSANPSSPRDPPFFLT